MRQFAKRFWPKARLVLLLLLGALIGYAVHGRIPAAGPERGEPAGAPNAAAEAEILFWTCSMDTQIRKPGPGLCPICGMELYPFRAEATPGMEPTSLRQFTTSPEGRALMDIQTSPVERRFVTAVVRVVGKVAYDETRVGNITAWVPGRLDRLYVDYTGVEVKKGDHMVSMYSPELLSTQEELLQALKAVRELSASNVSIMKETAQATVEAARGKLKLLGLTPEQIGQIEARGASTDHVTIYAPMGGTVIHKNVLEGAYVQTGTQIYTIADLSRVWVLLDVYESDLTWVRYGQKVEFAGEAYPGETFVGRIAFIDPVVNAKTRTVKVRVNVPNPDGRLKPDMFVRAQVRPKVAAGGRVMDPDMAGKWICPMHPEIVKDEIGSCDICGMPLERAESLGYVSVAEQESAKPLVIPVSAALVTGTRAIAYVEDTQAERPTFVGREVVLGVRAGDYYIVRHGLEEGELVVTRGNFKIDSALQIQAQPSMMTPEGGGAGMAHHHGAEAPASAQAGGPAAMPVPEAVRAQLGRVEEAYAALSDAMKDGDLERIKEAFAEVGKAIEGVEEGLLAGQNLMMWRELAMLLGNDAFEGSQIARAEEAGPVFALLERHVQRLREHFGLAHAAMAMSAEVMKAPPAFGQQLGQVWTTYRAVHAALVDGDMAGAVAAAQNMQNALDAVDMTALDHQAHMAWMPMLATMRAALREMAAAEDLEAVRAGLPALSEALAQAILTFGLEPAGAVYKLRCPMAFEGRGADWLQADTATRNPYYGAAMLTCGDVVQTILAEPAPAEGAHEHE